MAGATTKPVGSSSITSPCCDRCAAIALSLRWRAAVMSSRQVRASPGRGQSSAAARSPAHTTYSRQRGASPPCASAAATRAWLARWSGCGSRRQGRRTSLGRDRFQHDAQIGAQRPEARIAGDRDRAVGAAQAVRGRLAQPETGQRAPPLAVAQRPPRGGVVARRARVRSGAVGDQQRLHRDTGVAEQREQAAAAERFVVGVRRDDQGGRQPRQGAEIERLGGCEAIGRRRRRLADGRRVAHDQIASARTRIREDEAPDLDQRGVGRGLAQVVGEVAMQPLERLRPQQPARADRALGQLDDAQAGLLDRAAHHVRVGERALRGLRVLPGRPREGRRRMVGGGAQPEAGGLDAPGHLADPGALERIVGAPELAQESARLVADRLGAAELHRREADRAAAEGGLAVVVADGAEQLVAADAAPVEAGAKARAGAHAERLPERAVLARRMALEVEHQHLRAARSPSSRAAVTIARATWPSARGEGLAARQRVAAAPGHELHAVGGLGVPDAEEPAGQRVDGGPGLLLLAAVAIDQLQRVDVALEQPPGDQAAAADRAERLEQLGTPARIAERFAAARRAARAQQAGPLRAAGRSSAAGKRLRGRSRRHRCAAPRRGRGHDRQAGASRPRQVRARAGEPASGQAPARSASIAAESRLNAASAWPTTWSML